MTKHTLSGFLLVLCLDVLTTRGMETPRRADDFVDAIGINLDLDFNGATYSEAIVGGLGIRHYRSNVKPISSTLLTRLTSLYTNYGFRVNVVCDTTAYTPAQYATLAAEPMVESVEGLNEPDIVGPRTYRSYADNWSTNSYPATLAFQHDLFQAMNAQPATADKPVLSPAMANPANERFLRSAAADIVAMHSYPAQQMPMGNYFWCFTIPAALAMQMPGTPPMPLMATETGYTSGTATGDITNLAASKYVPRTFAEYFRLQVSRAYLFELADVAGQYNYGILDGDFTPKPSYTTTKNLIALLSEATWNASTQTMAIPDFNPTPLDYTLSGVTPTLHHLVLQKSTGAYYLLLWQEIPSYDLTHLVDISNSTIPVQVSLNTSASSAALYHLESTSPVATYTSPQSITVNVPDEVVVLEIIPGVAQAATGAVVSLLASPAGSTVAPFAAGAFALTRTGSSSAVANITYSIGGTATNGFDYSAISGVVQIPAGSAQTSVTIDPTNPVFAGSKDVVLTLAPSASYQIANHSTSKVYINASRTLVSNFSNGIADWAGSTFSQVKSDTANADSGTGDMIWSYNPNGTNRWANYIMLTFTTPQDWSAVTTLELRIKEGTANAAAIIGKPIYFAYFNNGVGQGGGFGVAKFPLTGDSTYRTISLDLGAFPRDQVNSIMFYVDGKNFPVGSYTFFIGSVTAVTDMYGVLDDFEQYAGKNWSGSAKSTVASETQNVDTGAQALRWTFNSDSSTKWDNSIQLNLPQAMDLSRYSVLSFRIKESSANPAADAGQSVYLDWSNNGASASKNAGVGTFQLTGQSTYRTVEMNLGGFLRSEVTSIYLYVNGSKFPSGKHVWYLDNITVH